MRVLYLINYAGKAGTEKYVENLVRILGSEKKIEPYFAYNISGELSEKMERAGVPSLHLDMGKKSMKPAAKKLADYCRNNEIEVIHAQYPRENMIAIMSKKYYGKPKVVLTNHLTLELTGVKGFIWRRLNAHYTPSNHCIIAVCNEGKDIMIENGVSKEKIKVIFNGIEPPNQPVRPEGKRSELGLDEDTFVVTNLARLSPEKGLDFMLEGLAELKKLTDKPFCVLVCGDGELKDSLEAKILDLGLGRECKLLGYRNDVKDILLSSDAYVCSSSHNEAMSFAILEAMSCGLPLVVTDVGGNRDLAETGIQCGYVVNHGDNKAFADRLQTLIEKQDIRETFSQKALEKVSKDFNINKLADDVFASYK